MPATGFLELAAAAFAAAQPGAVPWVRDVELQGALVLDAEPVIVQVHLSEEYEHTTFRISSSIDGERWTVHATGWITDAGSPGENVDLDAIRGRCPETTTGRDLYAGLAARDVRYGPMFQGVEQVWTGTREALGLVEMRSTLAGESTRYRMHPAVLDAAIHPIETLLPGADATFLPVALGALRVHRPPVERMWSHVTVRDDRSDTIITVDVTLSTDDGTLIAELTGLRVVRTNAAAVAESIGRSEPMRPAPNSLFELVWQPVPAAATAPEPGPWLIVGDQEGIGATLARRLQACGGDCVIVAADDDLTDLATVIAATAPREVVFLRGLDIAPPGSRR